MRCALQVCWVQQGCVAWNRCYCVRACLFVCLFVCMFVCLSVCYCCLVAFYELTFEIFCVICQCNSKTWWMTNPLRQNLSLYFALNLSCNVTRLVCCQPGCRPNWHLWFSSVFFMQIPLHPT
jgi:hypothetical protein